MLVKRISIFAPVVEKKPEADPQTTPIEFMPQRGIVKLNGNEIIYRKLAKSKRI